MSGEVAEPALDQGCFKRLLGEYHRGIAGPTLLAMGGVHGNEPGGVHASLRVLDQLKERGLPLRGRFVAVAGNLAALSHHQRFLSRDLNRRWLPTSVGELRDRDAGGDDDEDREQRELVEVFEHYVNTARGPLLFVDLHTCSSMGAPFTCFSDTLTNRSLAESIPCPMVLGLEETIDGAALDFFNDRGLPCLAMEGGNHDADSTIERLAGGLWLLLVQLGCLDADQVRDLARYRRLIADGANGFHGAVEIRRHHQIAPEDGFQMEPGYENLQPVKRGDLLAKDVRGEIRATEDCRILLPLYQEEGSDGFFLTREVSRFWLGLGTILRRLRFEAVLSLVPGVRRDPSSADTFLVKGLVASWLARSVMSMLGFRRHRCEGDSWIISRRHTDLPPGAFPWRPTGADPGTS